MIVYSLYHCNTFKTIFSVCVKSSGTDHFGVFCTESLISKRVDVMCECLNVCQMDTVTDQAFIMPLLLLYNSPVFCNLLCTPYFININIIIINIINIIIALVLFYFTICLMPLNFLYEKWKLKTSMKTESMSSLFNKTEIQYFVAIWV